VSPLVPIVLVLVVSSSKSAFLPRFVSDRELRLSAKIHSEDRSQPSCQHPSFEDEDDDEDDYDRAAGAPPNF
jgi:hypothetical protein